MKPLRLVCFSSAAATGPRAKAEALTAYKRGRASVGAGRPLELSRPRAGGRRLRPAFVRQPPHRRGRGPVFGAAAPGGGGSAWPSFLGPHAPGGAVTAGPPFARLKSCRQRRRP